jgi:hypothetical protein
MKPADALKIIRERAQDSGHIFILRHARQRMIERGVDDLDVQRCLRGGVITEGPYVPVDSRTGAWRCNVEGIINGDRLRVVVELPKEPPDLLVVTVIDLGR